MKKMKSNTKTYKNRAELEENTVNHGDHIMFDILNVGILDYRVNEQGFLGVNEYHNSFILEVLNIQDHQKFCFDAYGYVHGQQSEKKGYFPYCRKKDYDALKKMALALFDAVVEHNKKILEKTKPYTRFDLMEWDD